MLALIDGNNFYVSCERVFNPKLEGVPVVEPAMDDPMGGVAGGGLETRVSVCRIVFSIWNRIRNNSQMPLSALLVSEPIYAFNFRPDAWQKLRERASELRFPCCDAGVVLKRSRIGTQFFAHARKGACITGPESIEHLQAKDAIARAAIAAGWKAETEVRGRSPAGDDWIADVLVTRGSVKLAFEVQWARQATEVTQIRQARYETSGVRALWLMRQKDIPKPSKALPAFLIERTDNGFCIAVDWDPIFQVAKHRYPLDRFVQGALGRQLVWRPMTGKKVALTWRVRRRSCEVCSTWNQIPLVGRLGAITSITPNQLLGKPDVLIETLLPADIRRRHQIAKLYFDGAIAYESCRRCGASLMDLRYLYGKMLDLPAYGITLSSEVLDALDDRQAFDWWGVTA